MSYTACPPACARSAREILKRAVERSQSACSSDHRRGVLLRQVNRCASGSRIDAILVVRLLTHSARSRRSAARALRGVALVTGVSPSGAGGALGIPMRGNRWGALAARCRTRRYNERLTTRCSLVAPTFDNGKRRISRRRRQANGW